MNNLTIVGNLTRPVELKFLNNGSPAGRFSVAVTKKGFNDKPDTTSYVNVSVIGPIAENCANTLDKGTRVVVTGRMEQRTWQKEDGSKGEIWELNAEAVGVDLRFNTATVAKSEGKKHSFAGAEEAF